MWPFDSIWYTWMNGVYGCGSGVMRVLGQTAWSRYIANARIIAVMKDQSERLQKSIDDTQSKLKNLRDELRVEEGYLDAAVSDVRAMSNKRIHERRVRAERMGITFTYKKTDLFTWMNDHYEIKRIDELRMLKMRCSNLKKAIEKLHAANHDMQLKQAEFENTVCNAELSDDFERIADTLNAANNLTLDKLLTDMMIKAYKLADAMEASADRTRELAAENAAVLNAVPAASRMNKDEEQDIIDLIFETTVVPPPRQAPVPAAAAAVTPAAQPEMRERTAVAVLT